MFSVNNKKVTKKELTDVLKDPNSKIEKVSVSIDNPKKDKTEALSNIGFAVDQEIISGLSKAMDRNQASVGKLTLEGSPRIKNRTLYIIMVNEDDSKTHTVLKGV